MSERRKQNTSGVRQIKVVLKQNPDMRLGQLLLNVVKDPMLYYIEDDVLIAALKEFYAKGK